MTTPPRRTPGPTAGARAQLAADRRREKRLLAVIAVALVVLVVGGVLGYRAFLGPAAQPTVGPPTTAGQRSTDVLTGRPLLLGDASAPVTLTLYEDFHCPHCADFEQEFGPTVATLRDAGTLKVDLMPMAFIDDGSTAASAAMACAAAAGFGPELHDALFADHEQQWDADLLVGVGLEVGGPADQGFEACVRTDARSAWVESVNDAAAKANVVQTPTAFLDGAPVDIERLTPQTLTDMVREAARP